MTNFNDLPTVILCLKVRESCTFIFTRLYSYFLDLFWTRFHDIKYLHLIQIIFKLIYLIHNWDSNKHTKNNYKKEKRKQTIKQNKKENVRLLLRKTIENILLVMDYSFHALPYNVVQLVARYFDCIHATTRFALIYFLLF